MKKKGDMISYIRHPFARNSYWNLGLGVLGLLLAGTAVVFSVQNAGNGGLITGALGFSSIASAIMGLWYGLKSFLEREKNYLLAKIGTGVGLVVVLFWVGVMISGLI